MHKSQITTLFLDVGGVFLSNGWDHGMREQAAQKFGLDFNDMNKRHALTFDTFEIGKISLDVYLDRVIFNQKRNFTKDEFLSFMYACSKPYPEMIQMIRDVKKGYGLRTVAVSNEGRELMEHRIQHFEMKTFIDFFVCSGFVGLRKPDEAIYQLALDLAQVKPFEVIYVDDRSMLTEIGSQLGLQAIQHKTFQKTQTLLRELLSNQVRKDQ